jgi:phytoene dehydrogenase-like protein
MITAQSKSEDVPFLFAAPALTYPHAQNFYVPGGLWNMAYACTDFIGANGGKVITKAAVTGINALDDGSYLVKARNRKSYKSKIVVLNTPIWNAVNLFEDSHIKKRLAKAAQKFEKAWGAFTMGVVFKDSLEATLPLHHQIHYSNNDTLGQEGSIFVSLSKSGDLARVKEGYRTANVSMHTEVEQWYTESKEEYELLKEKWTNAVLTIMASSNLNISHEVIDTYHAATPITWEKWVGRSKGKVGGLPQSMKRSVLDWPDLNPVDGVYLVGDTTYPGQGIPGVTLSGINVYYRIKNKFSHLIK